MGPSGIHLLVLDVDGVLTPGDVTYDDAQGRAMSFDIHDGLALKLWRRSGRRVALLSSRSSQIVLRRARELGIDELRQGVDDKRRGFTGLLTDLGVAAETACYVGDDVPDLGPLGACGFAVAVGNAAPVVKRCADYVTLHRGGRGAVAEVIELLLRKQNCWVAPVAESNEA